MTERSANVLWHVTMSLDGFIAGPGDALDWVFDCTGPNAAVDEAIRTTGSVLAGRRELADERGMASALAGLALLALAQGDDARAARLYEESLTLSRKRGDQHLIAETLNGLGVVALNQGYEARAVMLVEESLALYRDLGNTRGIADALRSLGWLALNRGDLVQAAPLLEESLALYRQQ